MERLLDKELLERVTDRTVSLKIGLKGTACNGKFMCCRVLLGGETLFDGEISEEQIIKSESRREEETVRLSIETYGKGDDGTRTSNDGEILENRSISIADLVINGVDYINSNYIYRGIYEMSLSNDKEEYLRSRGFQTKHNDYHFFEDGEWHLDISVPVLKGLIDSNKTTESYEMMSYEGMMEEIVSLLKL